MRQRGAILGKNREKADQPLQVSSAAQACRLHLDSNIVRHSGVARLSALLLILLALSPSTAPFATCELASAHDGVVVCGWKAPTDPDEVPSLPAPLDRSHPLLMAVGLVEAVSADQPRTYRLIVGVLRV
jgi:hypothetical protein